MSQPMCRTCRYFFPVPKPASMTDEEREKTPQIGQCRCAAPTVGFVTLLKPSVEAGGMLPAPERLTSFPQVHDDVWCGEYAPKVKDTVTH